jgi:sodium/bile acid cotransporter 7
MKLLRMLLTVLGIAAMVLALAGGIGFPVWAEEAMSDDAKRAAIEAMYRNYKKEFADVQDISPAEAMALYNAGRAVFVDVREAKEQEVSMLPGAVTEKGFIDHPERFSEKVVIGYCTISYRSGKLAQRLKARGLDMLNLEGGLLAWVHAGGKVFDRSGETRRIHVYGRKWNLGPKDYEAIW